MFYALAKRLTRKKPERFYPVYAIACIVGFGLSFAGFQPLVSSLYPILGYLGLFVMAVMTVTYLRHRSELKDEGERRADAVEAGDGKEVDDLASESNLEEDEFKEALEEEIESSEDCLLYTSPSPRD